MVCPGHGSETSCGQVLALGVKTPPGLETADTALASSFLLTRTPARLQGMAGGAGSQPPTWNTWFLALAQALLLLTLETEQLDRRLSFYLSNKNDNEETK